MTIEQKFAFSLAGIGLDSTKPKGALFGEGERPDGLSSDWEWHPRMEGVPDSAECRVDLLTGELDVSGVELRVGLTPELRKLLLFQDTDHEGVLLEAITSTATSARFSKTGLTNKVIHLGLETIRVGAASGDGQTYAITRGYWSSTPEAHASGLYFFLRPSYWRYREVRVWEVADGVLRSAGMFWLDWRPVTTASLTCKMSAVSAVSAARQLSMASTPALTWSDRYRERLDGSIVLRGGALGWSESQLMKPGAAGSGAAVFLVDGALVHRYQDYALAVEPLLGSDWSASPGDTVSSAHEVALWSPKVEEEVQRIWFASGRVDTAPAAIAPTSNCPYPHHPATIAASILFSTNGLTEVVSQYDVLAPGRGLNLRALISAEGLSEWRDLVAETSHLKVDHYLLDLSSPQQVFDELQSMLVHYGLIMTVDSGLQLRLRRIGPGTVSDHANAPALQLTNDLFEQTAPQSSVVDEVTATVGELPWSKGEAVSTATLSAEIGGNSLASRLGSELAQHIDIPWEDRSRARGTARLSLVGMLRYRYKGVPEILLQAQPHFITGVDWALGDRVRPQDVPGLEDALILDENGELVTSLQGEQFLGQLIGVRPMPESAGALEIRLALTNFPLKKLVKWRAPSLVVESMSGTDRVLCAASSDFGLDGVDADYLEVGDQVEVWTHDGEPRAIGTRTITAIAGTQVQINAAFDSLPVTGNILRLAEAPDYSNEFISGVPVAYVYLAEDEVIPGYGGRDVYG